MYNIDIRGMTEDQLLKAMTEAYANNPDGKFTLTLPDGRTASIEPFNCKPDHNDCEWFFVNGTEDPYASDDSLAKLAKYFANYDDELERRNNNIIDLEKQRQRLAAIEDKQSEEYQEMFDFYSDCFKSTYGYRPKRV